jgi:hypothetical protein
MMYHEKFVASVKVGGRIMREQKETVLLPFGSDYSLLLKNLSTKRARVGVSIDGEDVLDGNRLVVNPNEDYELQRFIINGDMNTGPRFKFIEKTGQISATRGDRVDDGILRVTYAFELSYSPILKFNADNYYYGGRGSGDIIRSAFHYSSGDAPLTFSSCHSRGVTGQSSSNVVEDSLDNPIAESEAGITTKGAESNQSFTRTTMGPVGEEHAIVLYLRGTNESGVLVAQPVTVKRKNKCDVCGQINRSEQKYCGGCGTNLDW